MSPTSYQTAPPRTRIIAEPSGIVKPLYSSSRLVTLGTFSFLFPALEELQRREVSEGLMGADGVVGVLPTKELVVQRAQSPVGWRDFVKLLGVGALGALNVGVEFGRAGREHEQGQAAPLAGEFEFGGELAAAIDLHRPDREGHATLQSVQESSGGTWYTKR